MERPIAEEGIGAHSLGDDPASHDFSTNGQVRVHDFLSLTHADSVRNSIVHRTDWALTLSDGENRLAALSPTRQTLSGLEEAEFIDSAYAAAKRGFSYVYEVAEGATTDQTLCPFPSTATDSALALFLQPSFTQFIEKITSLRGLCCTQLDAVRLGQGHFLGFRRGPSADVSGAVGFVFDLTPSWAIEWGGLLQFIDAKGDVSRAFPPQFNQLIVFSAVKRYGISLVTPLAAHPRYSIVGWLTNVPSEN